MYAGRRDHPHPPHFPPTHLRFYRLPVKGKYFWKFLSDKICENGSELARMLVFLPPIGHVCYPLKKKKKWTLHNRVREESFSPNFQVKPGNKHEKKWKCNLLVADQVFRELKFLCEDVSEWKAAPAESFDIVSQPSWAAIQFTWTKFARQNVAKSDISFWSVWF